MSALLRRLLAFLTLAVASPSPDEGTDPASPDPATASPDADAGADTGDASLDDLIDLADPDQSAAPDPADNALVKEARRRIAELEADNDRLRRTPAPAPLPAARDPQFDAEEQQLATARASGDTNVLYWIEQNVKHARAIRASESSSRQALTTAEDVRDQTQFEKLEITNPKVYAKYSSRVEAAVTDMRSKGQSAPRMLVLRMMIGDDMLGGKIGTKKAPAAKPTPVDRGTPAPGRGDMRAKGNGKASDKEARKARLTGVPI